MIMRARVKMKAKMRKVEYVNVKIGLVIALPLLLITNLTPPSKFLSLIQFKIKLGEMSKDIFSTITLKNIKLWQQM